MQAHRTLSAFRITYDDGESYVTSMAAGITLEQARAYFIGQRVEMNDEQTIRTIVAVEEVRS